jgi:hypothetical protein
VKFRDPFRLEIKREKFCKFLDAEWAGSHCDELKEVMGIFPVYFPDVSQRALVSLIKCVW